MKAGFFNLEKNVTLSEKCKMHDKLREISKNFQKNKSLETNFQECPEK